MPKYTYKATDQDGNISKGVLETANVDELELRLERMGLMLISQKTARGAAGASFFKRSPITRQDLIIFCFNMEQMTNAGVPVLDGLKGLRDELEKPSFRKVVAALVEDIEAGKRLSEAMQSQPEVFDEVFSQLIQMGERTGCVDKIFLDMTENLKWEDELISQVKKVMMYPLVVSVVVSGLVFFLMIFLVPKLVGFITGMGGDLPIHTIALIATSDFISEWWYVIMFMPVAFIFFIKTGSKMSINFRRVVDRIKLRLWLFGPLSRKIVLVRFASAFALMYKSGIAVLECLKISEGLADNLVLKESLQRARGMVSDGMEISASFKEVGLFPPLLLRMLKVGETTGNLDVSLRNISYFYNREVKEMIGKLETMIEPVMTLVLGLIIGWVILSVLGPIYDIIGTI